MLVTTVLMAKNTRSLWACDGKSFGFEKMCPGNKNKVINKKPALTDSILAQLVHHVEAVVLGVRGDVPLVLVLDRAVAGSPGEDTDRGDPREQRE